MPKSWMFNGWIIACVTALYLITAVNSQNDDEDSTSEDDISHGLGDHIEWHTLEDGLALSKAQQKPLMLIIHKSWCGACKSLKPKFKKSEQIGQKSSQFIMVNTMDEDEPVGDIYQPDGGYIPRILFFDPEGEFLDSVINENGNPKYKYYYYDDEGIVTSMDKVISMYGNSQDNSLKKKVNESQTKSEL